MKRVRVVALGNEAASDDGAALLAARRIEHARIVEAGRPGPDLLDILADAQPTILVDVTCSGAPAGRLVVLPLHALPDAAATDPQVSCHGFGPAQTLLLGRALGRPLPSGLFIGIEGQCFTPGYGLSTPVRDALEGLVATLEAAVARLQRDT